MDNFEYEPDDNFGFFQRQEKDLLNAVFEELDKYDLFIGHNIKNFDIPYLRSRAYQHQINWFKRPLFYDTLTGFRNSGFLTRQNGFGKPCASMDMVADFLGLDQLKTKIYPSQHWQNIWGNKKQRLEAMNLLVDHCERDCRMNAAMYPILLENDPKVTIKRM
jgi:DNA polymerase elongation subunit (family B)